MDKVSNTSINDYAEPSLSDRDWLNRGKADAWEGKPKQTPHDPQAASMYDLGYCEGEIERPPTQFDKKEQKS